MVMVVQRPIQWIHHRECQYYQKTCVTILYRASSLPACCSSRSLSFISSATCWRFHVMCWMTTNIEEEELEELYQMKTPSTECLLEWYRILIPSLPGHCFLLRGMRHLRVSALEFLWVFPWSRFGEISSCILAQGHSCSPPVASASCLNILFSSG